MDKDIFVKRCIACGLFTVFAVELLICHECSEKLHSNPHLPEGGFSHEQLFSESISLSATPASGATFYTTLEDINISEK